MHPLQIEGQSDPFPFAGYGIKAAQRELAEAHDVFDDPKHRFDRAFTTAIVFASCLRLKPPGHGNERIFAFGCRRIGPKTVVQWQMMRFASQCNQGFDLALGAGFDVGGAQVTVVGRREIGRASCRERV